MTAETPIRDAVVVAGPGDAERRIAGVPLLVRTILTLQRAGVERVTLVGATPPRDRRVRCTVTPAASPAPARSDALHLVLAPGTVVDEALVRDLQRRIRPGRVVEIGHDGARVRVVPGSGLGGNGPVAEPPAVGVLEPATRSDAILERTLLQGLENPRDGYLDRLLHRRLSRPLTRLLLHTPLSPNAVTVLGVLAGIAGGLALGSPSLAATAAGVAGLLLSGVLDCSDGELARIRFHESRLGHVLDVVGDTLVHVALLAGIAMRLSATGTVPPWPVLALLGAGVVGAFAVMTACELLEDRRRRAGGAANRVIDAVLSPLSTRDWYVFPLVFAVLGRLDWLVPAAAVGANVFWVVTLVLLASALRRA